MVAMSGAPGQTAQSRLGVRMVPSKVLDTKTHILEAAMPERQPCLCTSGDPTTCRASVVSAKRHASQASCAKIETSQSTRAGVPHLPDQQFLLNWKNAHQHIASPTKPTETNNQFARPTRVFKEPRPSRPPHLEWANNQCIHTNHFRSHGARIVACSL